MCRGIVLVILRGFYSRVTRKHAGNKNPDHISGSGIMFPAPPVPHARPFKALWRYFPEIIHHPRNPKLHSSRPNVSAHMWYCLLYCICRLSPPLFCFPCVDHWWWPNPLLPRESGRNATHWSTPRELQKTKIGRKIASRLRNLVCWDLLPEDQYQTRQTQDWCTTIMQLCGARIIEDTCLIMLAQSFECLSSRFYIWPAHDFHTLGSCQATTHTIFLDDSLQW